MFYAYFLEISLYIEKKKITQKSIFFIIYLYEEEEKKKIVFIDLIQMNKVESNKNDFYFLK